LGQGRRSDQPGLNGQVPRRLAAGA